MLVLLTDVHTACVKGSGGVVDMWVLLLIDGRNDEDTACVRWISWQSYRPAGGVATLAPADAAPGGSDGGAGRRDDVETVE